MFLHLLSVSPWGFPVQWEDGPGFFTVGCILGGFGSRLFGSRTAMPRSVYLLRSHRGTVLCI